MKRKPEKNIKQPGTWREEVWTRNPMILSVLTGKCILSSLTECSIFHFNKKGAMMTMLLYLFVILHLILNLGKQKRIH